MIPNKEIRKNLVKKSHITLFLSTYLIYSQNIFFLNFGNNFYLKILEKDKFKITL